MSQTNTVVHGSVIASFQQLLKTSRLGVVFGRHPKTLLLLLLVLLVGREWRGLWTEPGEGERGGLGGQGSACSLRGVGVGVGVGKEGEGVEELVPENGCLVARVGWP